MATAERGARRELSQRRKALGFTQESLAAHLHVERSTVVRWEAGKSEPLAWQWPNLATALQVTPEQLTDLLAEGPVRSVAAPPAGLAVTAQPGTNAIPNNPDRVPHADRMLGLRRVLLGCIPDTPPSTRPELMAAVTHVWDLFFWSRFGEMERTLPTVLASAYSAAGAAPVESRRQVNISIAQLLHATSNLLGYVGQEDMAALALLRADALAAESGDELTRAAIRGSHSWLLTKNGMYDDAAAHAEQAATEIEPRLSTATPRHISIWGELLCYAAFAASRTGDHREARRYLRLCESAGSQLDGGYSNRPEASNVFGHTSAASFGVINETGADRPREALKLAAIVRGGGTGIPPTVLSRRLINVAQAQVRNRDDVGAVDTLRHASSMAPEFVGHVPLAHTLTHELLTRRSRKRLNGLADIADHLGVSACS